MSELTFVLPIVGLADKTEDVKVTTALTTLQTWAAGGIGTANLEAKSITDALIATNRQLVATNNTYTGAAAAALAVLHKAPEPLRSASVVLSTECTKGQGIEVKVGGKLVGITGNVNFVGSLWLTLSFILNPGEEWEAIHGGFEENPAKLDASYKTL